MKKKYLTIFLLCISVGLFSQQNSIVIKAELNTNKDELNIQQEIVFHNNSSDTLSNIFLHNWANSYKNNNTPLTKRLIEDFRKSLFFAKKEERGHSEILNVSVNHKSISFSELENQADILKIDLATPLQPKDSTTISVTYKVKFPNAKFTGYGKTANGYHLRFWYLTPAIYKEKWQLMSNLNIDDLFESPTKFELQIKIPNVYNVESNLYQYKTKKENFTDYFLVGQNKTDIILSIDKTSQFKSFNTKNITIHTDLYKEEIDTKLSTNILNRELLFIDSFLGKYPHKEIFVDKITQKKNPIYGLNQLPNFLRPFSDVFKWDITMFKAISKKYIESTLLLNKRTDYWLIDGLQTYLMMEYVKKYYPEVKLLGKVADSWGIRNFNFAKLNFNDKYPFVYQFSVRRFLDQPLTTRADSLSNFNRKIANKYKAGLGLRYLKGYLGDSILHQAIKEFYLQETLQPSSSAVFADILTKKTNKDVRWFFGDYIQTNKKIDYTIKQAVFKNDSVEVTIKNKRNITAPVALYGLKEKTIVFKKWITNIDTIRTITIPKGQFTRLILNYESLYPEYNSLDNSKRLKKRFLNKPLKFTFFKDIESPNHHQIFYEPEIKYNFYNGIMLGAKLNNKPIIKKNLELKISPSYATKSQSVLGSFSMIYNQFFEKTNIYKITYGVVGSTLHYAPNLSYSALTPYLDIDFKRKSLRDAGGKRITARLVLINKENAPGIPKSPQDKYSVFNLAYTYSKPDIIKGVSYRVSSEIAKDFSKLSLDFRYRKLTAKDKQIDLRFYAGTFLTNNTTSDYFSFGLDRANDYLFKLNYLGRSESSGIFSQQFILAEGGFKSVLPTRFANQFMISGNSNIAFWRWAGIYNDAAIFKNKNSAAYFAYENGVRFNFIDNILEFYLPIYSNNGFEVTQNAYVNKIRFVFTANPSAIYNFFRRGFL